MPPHSTTAIVSTGVDTLTCSVAWEGGISSFIDLGQYLLRDEALHGSKSSFFKRGSYRGAQTRGFGLGFAPGRVLAELRGNTAHEWWPHFLDRAEKVSRLDLEVSVRQEPYDHDMALRLWRDERKRQEQRGRPSTFKLVAESDGGTTLYIGNGASRYQARLYERFYKTHLKEDIGVWRYEVQARRERAKQMADLLVGSEDPLPQAVGCVHSHFAHRGVAPIFSPSPHVPLAPLPTPETDKDRSLSWLSSAVAPTLERHVAWGSYQEALMRIGVSPRGEQQ